MGEEYIDWHQAKRAAKYVAKKYHYGQKYGDCDYIYHLIQVVLVLESFENVLMEAGLHMDSLIVLGYLHDILEDTSCTEDVLESLFGRTIDHKVSLLSKYPGHSPKDYFFWVCQTKETIVVKLADRISNVEHLFGPNGEEPKDGTLNSRRLKRYRGDMKYFNKMSESNPEFAPMFKKLEDLIGE